ncbi:hypothetical protein J5U21_01783 [Saccharolobus shibatae]|uniref:Uncharacterized protein n=1 Tax=Saccharolobus shibatae TaxID=2286 RepID=A0A8F5GX63_9CREN|nr:hypothetical protein J5U21_01783 [Saccharolobus shibatae]
MKLRAIKVSIANCDYVKNRLKKEIVKRESFPVHRRMFNYSSCSTLTQLKDFH